MPKFTIFTSDKDSFLEKNSNIKDIIENKFYNLGGIQTLFEGVYDDFLINKKWRKKYNIENKNLNTEINGAQYTFEYINNLSELYLPVYFKPFFKLNEKDIFDELTHYLYDKYKENEDIKELLEPIDGIPDIPIEILCKYYARLYTIESDFYKDINKKLRKRNFLLNREELLFSANKNNYYSITFIKAFYEGLKLGCFNLDLKDKLYRFSCLEQKEIDKIEEYLNKKKQGIPGANLFSKSFLSFSEEEHTPNALYEDYKKDKANNENKNLVPVFFHLIKKEDIKKSLYTHINISNISKYENEKEVLFLPFTSFEILSVNKGNDEKYIIDLTYLGRYEEELKKIEKEEKIPETKFKSFIEVSNAVDIDPNTTNKMIIDKQNNYEKSFLKNNVDIYIFCDVRDEDIDENQYVSVFGKNYNINETDFVKENKGKIKILINNEEKPLEYKYKLEKGINKIVIKLNSDEIFNLEYMFSGCTSLKSIEGLKDLCTKNIKNFSHMFWGCKSLSDIDALENWDVSNGINFSNMFESCHSLSYIKALEKWNVSNGNNFSKMFCDCILLSDIKPLKNWNVFNGNYFVGMFRECKSLLDITPLKNWRVINGVKFDDMFSGCELLSNNKLKQSWNVNENIYSSMFGM